MLTLSFVGRDPKEKSRSLSHEPVGTSRSGRIDRLDLGYIVGRVEALQLALATLGGVNDGTLLVFLIFIAPSPAVVTSSSTSNLANPLISPWDVVDVVDVVRLVTVVNQPEPVTSGFLANTPVNSHE